MRKNLVKFYFALTPLLWMVPLCTQAQNNNDTIDLLNQIQLLKNKYKFEIKGLAKVGNEKTLRSSGSAEHQLRQLLSDYNHMIIQTSEGNIEQVIIVNKKKKSDPNRIVLATKPHGSHYLVSVSITGNGKFWQTLDLLVDTGSEFVVLPESMIDNLGISRSSLSSSLLQTVNGKVKAGIGKLRKVKIGGEILENVGVAFVPDDLLGNYSLLGMSVLGRFRITIDDKLQRITLFKM